MAAVDDVVPLTLNIWLKMDASDAQFFAKKVAHLNSRLNTYERNQYVLGPRVR